MFCDDDMSAAASKFERLKAELRNKVVDPNATRKPLRDMRVNLNATGATKPTPNLKGLAAPTPTGAGATGTGATGAGAARAGAARASSAAADERGGGAQTSKTQGQAQAHDLKSQQTKKRDSSAAFGSGGGGGSFGDIFGEVAAPAMMDSESKSRYATEAEELEAG